MKLTREQIPEFILIATSSSDGFNQLVEIMLNSLMQHERRIFLDERHRGILYAVNTFEYQRFTIFGSE
ncbi:MAG: hypothetical protein PUK67_00130 [Prevotellaceae bacterium]|nr:hypothetical protein [Prevotellaceae bacterium]MDY3366272.1 hypothetical protein [Prevotella sp.]